MRQLRDFSVVVLAIAITTALFMNFSLQQNRSKMKSTKVIELVVYQVNDTAKGNLTLIDDEITQKIQQFDGFISRTVHRSSEDSTIFMDYVTWESLAHAENANVQVQEMEEFQPFFSIINEVKSFNHFHIVE